MREFVLWFMLMIDVSSIRLLFIHEMMFTIKSWLNLI